MYRALAFSCCTLLAGCAATDAGADRFAASTADGTAGTVVPDHQRSSAWYVDAAERVREARAGSGARNVILFVGDGMGVSTVTAARILAGQRAGGAGEENRLSFEHFPSTGLSKTYNVNAQTPDSAGTMSAMVTGVKTNIGVFGVDESVTYGDCESGRELIGLLEIAELAGRATGVVSTARITHATPAATYAKVADRDWEDDAQLSRAARSAGCRDIAVQFLDFRQRLEERYGAGASDGIEVALGGGRRHFRGRDDGGRRLDGRDLTAEWRAAHDGGSYVEDARALEQVERAPLLGLLADSHMAYASERALPASTQPTLPVMTAKALDLLESDEEGYFLVVEAGRIDHAHHAGNAFNALNDTIEFADAVQTAVDRVDPSDTLIIVTADHSHVFTIAGYPRRGNPILGKVVAPDSDSPTLDENGLPYTTLGYANGRGYRDHGDELDADRTYADPPAAGRFDLTEIDTTAPGYHQEALVPLGAETHGGEDVAIYAAGPGARAVAGVQEQNLIYHVMLQATGWDALAARRLAARRGGTIGR